MPDTREYRSSRVKAALYLLLSIGFVSLGFLPSSTRPGGWALWLAVGFFALGIPVFATLLIRPQRLLLDRSGFTVTGGLIRKPSTTRWQDMEGFFVYRLPKGGKMIGYNYSPDAPDVSSLVKVSRRFGADAALPKGWPGSPDVMVDELNAFRERALASR
jgi:hypothetical protein